MSDEEEFEVRGPYEEVLEPSAENTHSSGDKNLTGQIALITAIFSATGAIFSYMAGATQSNAAIYKNNASIKKTEASNQWEFYQAKSTRQHLAEVAADLVAADKKAAYTATAQRYAAEKPGVEKEAARLDKEAADWEKRSEEQTHLHHRWAQAASALQMAIALGAVSLLSRKKWLEYVMLAVGILGMLTGALALLHI